MSSFLLSRFDAFLLTKFESARGTSSAYPSVEELVKFLSQQIKQKENVALLSTKGGKPSQKTTVLTTSAQPNNSRVPSPSKPANFSCSFCSRPAHKIYACAEFLKLTPQQRSSWARSKRQCPNCLGSHGLASCQSKLSCRLCHRRHHTLLHFSTPTSATKSGQVKTPDVKSFDNLEIRAKQEVAPENAPALVHAPFPASASTSVPTLMSSHGDLPTVLLATCLVRLQITPDRYVILRCVLDSAAGASFITDRAVRHLNPPLDSRTISISGVNSSKSQTLGLCTLSLTALSGQPILLDHCFHLTHSISSAVPSITISQEVRQAAHRLILADPSFDTPSPVDCILGADVTAHLLTGGPPISLGDNMPYAVPTLLGYVLMGTAPSDSSSLFFNHLPHATAASFSPLSCFHANTASHLHALLERFWALEEPPSGSRELTKEEQHCEHGYSSTTTRDATGRYQVRLPFLSSSTNSLGDSYRHAYARFLSLERQFDKDPLLKQAYIEFMKDYQDQGHMCLASGPHYYFLPHHGIFKKRGDTNKIRVVFNASAPTSSGYSLNDLLSPGPKLQTLIADVLTLFRQFHYVFVADVKQMFRQIMIHPSDYPYQCVLWREDPSEPLRIYYLTTVTYGTRPAPYLAIRTLRQLAVDEAAQFPDASRALLTNIFVDDILVGASSIGDAIQLRDELICLLSKGGFALGKWLANHAKLLDLLPPESVEDNSSSACTPKGVLGIPWDTSEDEFRLIFSPRPSTTSITKRIVCSVVAQLYDPCGWASPITFAAKCLLQQLWSLPVDWDTPLNADWCITWQNFISSASSAVFPLSRPFSASSSYLLHGFADASQRGYAAVLYLVPDNPDAEPSLLASKTRVAPLKTITIPRLELCAALLLAELCSHFWTLLSSTSICINSVHLWTDSQIVLHWLRLEPARLKTFVANRVSQIQTLTSLFVWHHISSTDNPADIASRGSEALPLKSNELWWHGPAWIAQPPLWPTLELPPHSTTADLELQPAAAHAFAVQSTPCDLFPRLSSWPRILRVVRLILLWRYKNTNCTPTYSRVLTSICFYIQRQSFVSEIKHLSTTCTFPPRLKRLTPFLDSSGLLRVGGRLHNSQYCLNQHPILLPKNHRLVYLLIDYYHSVFCHAGLTLLHAQLSIHFWILCGRQTIRSRIFKCVRCFRAKPQSALPLMGHLPAVRVNPSPPFYHTGMDFAGPFSCKASALRKAPTLKVYLCIFVCMATKAIHLELASDLSSTAFLDTLQRFISRRGRPTVLYSDCGTNFVGSAAILKKELKRFLADPSVSDLIKATCFNLGIDFQFNTPSAPHQGGLWERAIRSLKYHLVRVVGNQVPTWEVFNSLVITIEGILNSRPLSVLSSDPTDLQALTPGHFLIGRPLTAYPCEQVPSQGGNRKHFHLLQDLQRSFWERWRRDYLPSLAVQSKWTTPSLPLSVGDVVVVSEPHAPPSTWPLARISEVFPSDDGEVRRVEVTTGSGRYLRPATKIFKLPSP